MHHITDGRTDAIPPGKKSRPELYCDTTEVEEEGRKKGGMKVLRLHHKRWL